MRFVYVIMVWVVLVGGLQIFRQSRSQGLAEVVPEAASAPGQYWLDVTTTFAVEPDPFALVTDTQDAAPALLVQLQGRDVIRITDRLAAGEPIGVDDLPDLKVGSNEFLVKAHPPQAQALVANALRLRLWRDDVVIAERTAWSSPPHPLVTTLVIEIEAIAEEDDQNHDH